VEKNDILHLFGKKVRRLRLDKGFSQEKLAEKTGFHRTYIGMIERGERNISLKNIHRLASCLDINIASLFSEL
jgi:transcriptional regulator with XRE-family HTH domain